jgi:hypothetical protein
VALPEMPIDQPTKSGVVRPRVVAYPWRDFGAPQKPAATLTCPPKTGPAEAGILQ